MGGQGTGWRLAGLALAWLAGVALHLRQASLPATDWHVASLLAGALGLALAWRWNKAFAAGWAGALLLAFGASGLRAEARLDDALPAALEGQDVQLTGVVASLPQRGASGLRFRFDVERASLRGVPLRVGAAVAGRPPASVPSQLALGWYRGFHDDAAAAQPQRELRAGQRWSFTVRLRRPHGNLNPHGYDYELQLFEQGLRATGYVREAPALRVDDAAAHPVERLRQKVRDAIDAHIADRRAAGVLAALAVGDQGAIERDDWDLFRQSGVAHLMSISGLHVTMFAWLVGAGAVALWRRRPRAMAWLPAPTAGRWAGLLAATGYAVFSGWGVPSQRTAWMLATVTVLQTLGLRWPWTLVLLTAAVVVTAIDPWALLQAGFWLSFAAVGLLMASAPAQPWNAAAAGGTAPMRATWLPRLFDAAHQGLRTQVVATLGLTPLTLVFFQQMSLVGFAANLVAIPLVTLVITPLALLGVLVTPLWSLGVAVIDVLTAWLAWLASWPAAVLAVPVAPLWAQLAGLLGAALWLLPLPWRARCLGLGLVWPLLLPPRDLPPDGGFDLLAADVGQGTAVLVRTSGHVLVFDSGPAYGSDSDAGERVLLPLLRALGDGRVDRLVLSHRDLDHVGGARSLFGGVHVADLLSSLEADHPLQSLAPRHARCAAGQSWSWDGVRFDVLWPPAADYERERKSNAMSCVLRIAGMGGGPGAGRSVLLTGDIEAEQEAALVAAGAGGLASDVLVVPHHGSKTSSTAAFLDAVRPETAVIQAGYRNRFGHPAADVLARYHERGIQSFVSPACGAWRWRAGEAPTGSCQRVTARRYWHDAGAE